MRKILFFAMALVASVVVFTACDKNDGNSPEANSEQVALLTSGTWVYQVSEKGYTYFEFSGNTFKYHEVASVAGMSLDAWMGGTYTLKGNTLTFTFTDTNVEEMRSDLSKYETTATLDGDKLIYSGHTFILTKKQ